MSKNKYIYIYIYNVKKKKYIYIYIYLSIIPAISVCVSVCLYVCMRPQFLDDRRSDRIETCQEYCRGPADVPFRGLISIGRAVPKLRPFICRPMTRHGAMTSRMTSQLMFIYLFIFKFFFARLTLQFFFFFVWYDVTIDAGDLSMCLFKV